MSQTSQSLHREGFSRIRKVIIALATDPEAGRKAVLLSAGLFLFLLIINGLNVVISYVGRDFMTAIADHNLAGFWWYLLLSVVSYAVLTVISVLHRYMEESLGLHWRNWLTLRIYRRYADHRVYRRLNEGHTLENADQRIAEDIKGFTTTTLSFTLMLLNGALTVIAFSGVLWTISPTLFLVAIGYAGTGTWLTLRLGRPLAHMNFRQLDREADFRASLIHLQENADAVALSRREGLWVGRSRRFLEQLVENFEQIIGINRQVGFFTTGYYWLIQLIPVVIVAPMFIEGRVEFGVITQAALAFSQLVAAFSLIITQFQSISTYSAVVSRLGLLIDACEDAEAAETASSAAATDHARVRDRVVFQNVTIISRQKQKPHVAGLSVEFHAGQPVRVYGPDEGVFNALFRASAGIREINEGTILRPPLDQVMFVAERPYLCPGSLRELFLRPHPELAEGVAACSFDEGALAIPDKQITSALKAVGLDKLLQRFGGFDSQNEWDTTLSLEEQQLLVIARVIAHKPTFVFLDRPDTSLPEQHAEKILGILARQGITSIMFAKNGKAEHALENCLELKAGGKWRWRPAPAR